MAQQGVSETGGGYTQARPAAGSGSGTRTTTTATPAGSKRPKQGTGGKRYVRTQAGAQRYKKPIGTEIVAQPRDQRGARAQTDKESVDRYKALVSGDARTQTEAMRKLSDDQLKRLSEVAFSFRSSDPAVAKLRAGVSIEMRKRSLDVNRYGGLSGRGSGGRTSAGASSGGGSGGVEVINFQTGERYRVQTKSGRKASRQAEREADADERRAQREAEMAERKRQAEEKRVARAAEAERKRKQREAEALARRRETNRRRYVRPKGKSVILSGSTVEVIELAQLNAGQMRKAVKSGTALPAPDQDRPGRFNIRNVSELRDAIRAFGRAKPEDREKIARFICKRAKALNAKHLVGEGILKAAGYSHSTNLSARRPIVIDLEGRWKHGWIPLDTAAVRAKTKGRSGAKPWWTEGAKGRTGTPSGKVRMSASGRTDIGKASGSDTYWRNLSDEDLRFEMRDAQEVLTNPHAGRSDKKRARDHLAEGKRRGLEAAKPDELTPAQRRFARRGKLAARYRGEKASERYAATAPDRLPSSRGDNSEYRKNAEGTYDLYVNGRKSRIPADQGLTRRDLAQGTIRPGRGGKIDERKDARVQKNRVRTEGRAPGWYERATQKSIARQQNKKTGGRVTFIEPVTERKSNKPFADPQTSSGRANLMQRTGRSQGGLLKPTQAPGAMSPDQLARNYITMHGRKAARQKLDRLGRKTRPTEQEKALRAALSRMLGH